MFNKIFTRITLVFCFIFFLSNLLANKDTGVIEGYVKDAKTGEALVGANIFITGTTLGAASDNSGYYKITLIEPGNYKLKVSYLGYDDLVSDIKISEGKTLVVDLELNFGSEELDEVVVTAQAEGQMQAINKQLSERTIMNVVSETKIRELPDANAAEALTRLPGVSVIRDGGEAVAVRVRGVSSNTIYVDGMRMEGDLGSVASTMIGGIELQKAFMPDNDADVLGGSVEFKMREAKSGFNKDIWLRSGYNGFTKSYKMFDASVLLSNRFFNDKLGVMVSLTFDKKDRGRDVLGAGYQSIGSAPHSEYVKPVQITDVTLNHTENLRNRYGATIFADYKYGSGKLFYKGFFSYLDGENQNSSNFYNTNGSSVEYTASLSKEIQKNFLNGFGGEQTLWGTKLDWNLSLSKAKSDYPRTIGIIGKNPSGLIGTNTVDTTTTVSEFIELGVHDITKTYMSHAFLETTMEESTELQFSVNMEIPFVFSNNIDGYLKFGTKVRSINREYNNTTHNTGFFQGYIDGTAIALEKYPELDWKYTTSGLLGFESFVNNPVGNDFSILNTQTYFVPNFDNVDEYISRVDGTFLRQLVSEKDNYVNNEQFYAGYIMAGIDLGSMFTFTPGVRYEYNKYETTAKLFDQVIYDAPVATQGKFEDVEDGHFNENWFPMVHLKFKPLNWFDVRIAYTKTVTRPDFQSMSPKHFLDIDRNQVMGNVLLRPQTNINYDIYTSFYTNKIGLFTIGLFYKELSDQVLNYEITIIDPDDYGLSPAFRGKKILQPVNNKWPGYVKGIELDWQTHFSYLPKPFNGIVLNVNVTLMSSETRYPFFSFKNITIPEPPYRISVGQDSSRVNKVIGMPDVVGNVVLGYEIGGFSGRVSMYYQSATIQEAQDINKALDESTDELLRFDLQLSQKLFIEGLTFYLNVNNFTNRPDREYLTNHPGVLVTEENYGWAMDIGARFQF